MNNPEQHRPAPAVDTAEQQVDVEQAEAMLPNPPMIYVASLADYNAGLLHGTWIDATEDVESMDHQIWRMLNRSQDPDAGEVAIHDHSGFGDWQVPEHESLEEIKAVADAIVDYGEAVTHWISYLGERPSQAIGSFEEAYLGNWHSMQAYARELAEDIGVSVRVDPPSWEPYAKIDFSSVARDMYVDMYASRASDGSLYVFDPGRLA